MKIKKIYFSILLTSIIYSSAIEANAISFKKDYGKEVQAIKMDKNLDMKSFSIEKAEELAQKYKNITKDLRLMLALDIMKECAANFSRSAILGNNLTQMPIKIEFKELSQMGEAYSDFDALGWKKKQRLYIYVNQKHADAPPIALAALLAHEALHQDEFNSINEETYAWTMEAAVWTQLSEEYPKQAESTHPLVIREDMLKKLFIKGNYTDKYIRKTVSSNPGYNNLPSRSPGFEDNL